MTEIETKRLACLQNELAYRNQGNRAVHDDDGHRCLYSPTKTSEGCAIGRMIADKKLCSDLDAIKGNSGVNHVNTFERLPEELKELGISFLCEMQRLHDAYDSWQKSGLTKVGEMARDKILKEFCGQ